MCHSPHRHGHGMKDPQPPPALNTPLRKTTSPHGLILIDTRRANWPQNGPMTDEPGLQHLHRRSGGGAAGGWWRWQLLGVGCWLLAVAAPATSYQLPATSCQPAASSAPPRARAASCELRAASCELATGECRAACLSGQWPQSSVTSCQLLPLAFGLASGLLGAWGANTADERHWRVDSST
jgi:hypothetical protein